MQGIARNHSYHLFNLASHLLFSFKRDLVTFIVLALKDRRPPLVKSVKNHELHDSGENLSFLNQRKDIHSDSAAKKSENAHGNPFDEEFLAENVRAVVH